MIYVTYHCKELKWGKTMPGRVRPANLPEELDFGTYFDGDEDDGQIDTILCADIGTKYGVVLESLVFE